MPLPAGGGDSVLLGLITRVALVMNKYIVQDVSSSHTGTGYERNAHIGSRLPHTTRPSVSLGVAPVRGSRSDRAEGPAQQGFLIDHYAYQIS